VTRRQTVGQLLIRWSEAARSGGVRVTMSSEQATTVAWWERRLLAAEWTIAEIAGAEPALMYLEFEDQAAIVRKLGTRDAHDRPLSPFAHVLVGPAAALDAGLALGLDTWEGWLTPECVPTRLFPVEVTRLRSAAGRGRSDLLARVAALPRAELAVLVGHVLAEPGGPLTLFWRDRALPDTAAYTSALLDILGDATQGPWTFALREGREPVAADRPRLVFLDGPPGYSPYAATGRRLPLDAPAPDDSEETIAFARALVDAYLDDPAALYGVLPPGVLDTGDAVARWRDEAQAAPGILASGSGLLRAIIAGGTKRVLAKVSAPSFAAYLDTISWAKLRHLIDEFADRLERTHPQILRTIQSSAVDRYLTGQGAPSAADLRTLRVPKALVAERLAAALPRLIDQPAAFVTHLDCADQAGVDLRDIAAVVGRYPPSALLGLADDGVHEAPRAARLLLDLLLDREPSSERDEAFVRALEERGHLAVTVESLHPGPLEASAVFARLFALAYGETIRTRAEVDRILLSAHEPLPYPLLHALGQRTRTDAARSALIAAAARRAFEDAGLSALPPVRSDHSTPRQPLPAYASEPAPPGRHVRRMPPRLLLLLAMLGLAVVIVVTAVVVLVNGGLR
jgi:hypothetical protein